MVLIMTMAKSSVVVPCKDGIRLWQLTPIACRAKPRLASKRILRQIRLLLLLQLLCLLYLLRPWQCVMVTSSSGQVWILHCCLLPHLQLVIVILLQHLTCIVLFTHTIHELTLLIKLESLLWKVPCLYLCMPNYNHLLLILLLLLLLLLFHLLLF